MTDQSTADDAEQFRRVLDDSVKLKILTALISEAGTELNPSQISRRADIDLETFYNHIDPFEEGGLVQYTYIVGNGPVYELNSDTLASRIEVLR